LSVRRQRFHSPRHSTTRRCASRARPPTRASCRRPSSVPIARSRASHPERIARRGCWPFCTRFTSTSGSGRSTPRSPCPRKSWKRSPMRTPRGGDDRLPEPEERWGPEVDPAPRDL